MHMKEVERMLTKSHLSSPCFDHKFSGEMCGRLRLQRTNGDAFIERVTRYDLKNGIEENRVVYKNRSESEIISQITKPRNCI